MTSLSGGSAKPKKADEPVKKVVLKKEDVTVIVFAHQFSRELTSQMTEFDISKIAAEKALRQNHGELIPTINQLINI